MSSSSDNISISHSNPYFNMWITDGIFFVSIFAEEVTLSIAQACISERLKLSKGISYPMLSDSRKVKRFDKDARQYLASKENTVGLMAGALVIDNQLQKLLGNFFILIHRPQVPSKLFTNYIEALEWLQQYKESSIG